MFSQLDIKGVYNSELKPLYTANKIAEQNNYADKIVNVQIVYYLDAWPRSHTDNFKFEGCNLRKECIQRLWNII